MLRYLLSATAIWLISLVLFDIFLRKENYHSYNRFYLLFTFLLGSFLPLWQWHGDGNNFGSSPWLVQWLTVIYLAGLLVAFSLLVIDIVKLVVYYRTGKKSAEADWTVIETGKEHPPFSYLDILFVTGRNQYSAEEWDMIITHEKQHSILLHLIDLLLMQFARIIFWFHPLVYIYNNRLLLVHEYQADQASTQGPQEYGRFLIEQSVLQVAPVLSHSFGRSPIKNRIFMIAKNGSARTGRANLKLLLVLPLTLGCLLFFTKNSYSIKPGHTLWKKQVARLVDTREKDDTVQHHLRDVRRDSTLMEMMANAIYAGKITAYSNANAPLFSVRLTKEALNDIIASNTDTVIISDPETGKELKKVVTHNDFNRNVIHKYRILEEWSYDPSTGKTEVEIQGIAPLRNIYGTDGSFRGTQALFYLRYADVQSLVARYEQYHPNNTLASHIWDDYFTSDAEKVLKE